MAPRVSLVIRQYRQGDETHIVPAFNEVFSVQRDSKYWRWKYLHHSRAMACVAIDEKQRVLAHIAAHPVTWIAKDLTWNVAHAGDAFCVRSPEAVHSKAMLRTLMCLHKNLECTHEVQLLFGFPSNTLSALHNTHSTLHAAPRPIKRWQRASTSAIDTRHSAFTVQLGPPSPAGSDAFWRRCATRYKLLCKRDWSWLNWRFLQRPDVDNYEFFDCKDSAGDLCAWAVVRELDGALWVCDLLWDGKAMLSLSLLLANIVHAAHCKNLSQVALWLQGDDLASAVLEQNAWRDYSHVHDTTLAIHGYDRSLDYEWIRKSLYVTKADSDLI